MHEDDGDVAVLRWLCRAAPGTIARTTTAVSDFAGVHGMPHPVLTRMTTAVSETLVAVFDAEREPAGTDDGTTVDAATDGLCLSVRIRGAGRRPSEAASRRLGALADRVEVGLDERTDTMTVLLEFPSSAADGGTTEAPGGRAAPSAQRDRPLTPASASSARRGSHAPAVLRDRCRSPSARR